MDKLKERAKELLNSEAYRGTHGFEGIALKVWEYQRDTMEEALLSIEYGGIYFDRLAPAYYSSCPTIISKYEGTIEGKKWVDEVHELIDEIVESWDFKYGKWKAKDRDDDEDE